jgi:hypothetical protein
MRARAIGVDQFEGQVIFGVVWRGGMRIGGADKQS